MGNAIRDPMLRYVTSMFPLVNKTKFFAGREKWGTTTPRGVQAPGVIHDPIGSASRPWV